ncbi:Putative negative regulator of RcsB-dependent stress response [Kushneria avicenniae]|uniref:Putative negative regulator of RcsB-dependent stress response n=1 Tax=Kushneria avicenniae TaxID=402385 RepID=A0A1I1L2U3_9GAMM|nr:tetratricopeptide repeat protein [Kushneria avicenniae]SFC66862.1 Putative negative regulator of RcsB-dependent stress response [Kushneria avicenniae]
MADQLNIHEEDDQLAAAKRLWHNYAKPILGGIIIAAAALFAWHWWQDHQQAQSEAASLQYQQLIQLTSQDSLDDNGRQAAQSIIDAIRDQHGGTLYADLAGMIQARLAVDGNDLSAAEQALDSVRQSSDRDEIRALSGLELARVQLGQDHADEALDTLDGLNLPEAMAARAADIRGDIQLALGHPAEARSAWQEAVNLAREHNQELSGIQLKLDDLAPQEAS